MIESVIPLSVTRLNKSHYIGGEVSYLLPIGLDENNRLVMQHNLLRKFFKGNFLAPIEQGFQNGITVLDSGCGPGVWTVDMANAYPKSHFYGIDIVDVVPDEWKCIGNTEFITGNITKDVPYEDNYFDFIHQRLLIAGLTRNDWVNLIKNFYRVLKPGGYVEFLEVQCYNFENAGPLFNELIDTFLKMMNGRKMVPHIDIELEQFVKDAGFININVVRSGLPMNNDEDEGKMSWENFYGVFDGLGPSLVEYNDKWNDISDFKAHIAKCREEMFETKTYFKFFVVYAQKPFV